MVNEPLPMFSDSMSGGMESSSREAPGGDKTFLMRCVERCQDLRAAMKDSSAQVWAKNGSDCRLGQGMGAHML